MEKLKKIVLHRNLKYQQKSAIASQSYPGNEAELNELAEFSLPSVDIVSTEENFAFWRDPQALQDLLNTVEENYYSMTFDSGKHEIEHFAGSNCRQLEQLRQRLHILGNQHNAVAKRVSELVLEKHPLYEAELKGVLLLQADNWDTLGLCRRIRRSLSSCENILVLSKLTVLRNYRRCLRLRKALHVMRHIRALQDTTHRLDSLLMKGLFCSAIQVHHESLVLLEDYRKYRCVEPIHLRLKALGSRIDDLLDAELEKSCEHFSEASYATVQQAFELLGSTQTMFAQLQMHYVTAIQRRSMSVVQSYVALAADGDESIGSEQTKNYTECCNQLPMEDISSCLSDVCQSLWLVLLCYHRTTLWHQGRACSKRPGKAEKTTSKKHRSQKISSDLKPESSSQSNGVRISKPHKTPEADGDEEDGGRPQLIRQWHEYVASKLNASRGRIWSEATGRIEPILKAMGQFVTDMSFKQISSVLHIVNHFVDIGEEFSSSRSSDLLEVLRTCILKFFKEFHRKHLERLRVFLGNETWEFCPVKSSFTVLDLHEYRSLSNILNSQNGPVNGGMNSKPNDCSSTIADEATHRFFVHPYCVYQFPVNTNESHRLENAVGATDATSERSRVPSATLNSIEDSHNGPLLSSTTLEVLRLIGRYLQMMNLLRPIAAEVMHCICQVFDYYLYSIFAFFGPIQSIDTAEIPDRLRLTLKRINDRLIAPESHPAVAKGDRFPLPEHEPMHIFNSVSRLLETMIDSTSSPTVTMLCNNYLQAHFVGVESVVSLADILESTLLPHFSTCLPERKRGLTSVFREQALTAARQLREPCAMQIVPQLVSLLLKSDKASDNNSSQTATGSIATGLTKLWSGSTTDKDSISISNNRLLTVAKSSMTNEPNFVSTAVNSMLWTGKNVATSPSPYVHHLHKAVFSPFGQIMHTTTQRLGLCEAAQLTVWNSLLLYTGNMLLNAYGQIQLCSEEGRGQMLLDVQSISVLAETESKIRSFPNLDRVIEYVQAFYIPIHEWEHWLTHTGTKYTRAQLVGLAHCLARGDRRQRQRLLNTVNQIYGTGSVQCAPNSVANQ